MAIGSAASAVGSRSSATVICIVAAARHRPVIALLRTHRAAALHCSGVRAIGTVGGTVRLRRVTAARHGRYARIRIQSVARGAAVLYGCVAARVRIEIAAVECLRTRHAAVSGVIRCGTQRRAIGAERCAACLVSTKRRRLRIVDSAAETTFVVHRAVRTKIGG